MELHEIITFKIHIIFSWNNDKKFHEGDYMNINDAIVKRIEEVCKEKNIAKPLPVRKRNNFILIGADIAQRVFSQTAL